jgi:hypothetical protein
MLGLEESPMVDAAVGIGATAGALQMPHGTAIIAKIEVIQLKMQEESQIKTMPPILRHGKSSMTFPKHSTENHR